MPNGVTHFEIMSKDGKKLTQFYSKLFGWEIQWSKEIKYGIVKAQDKGIGGGIGTKEKKGKWGVTFYVDVDDVDAYLAKAKKMRAKVIVPKTTIPGMVEFAVFKDPQGNIIGLAKNLAPPQQTPAM
jgi:hypothetical protein